MKKNFGDESKILDFQLFITQVINRLAITMLYLHNLHYEKFSDGTIKGIEKELKALKINIPKSWNWVRLGHIFMHNTGKALNSANQSGELLEYITTSNLYWNRFELQTLKKMYFTANEIDKCTVKKGDLLVCEGGDIGRAAIWNFDYDIRIQNHIHKLRPYVFVCTEFFYYLFYSYKNAGLIGGKGIGLQGLSSNALHSLLFPIPPVQEQLRITSAINSLFSSIDSINANRDELKALVNTTKSKILDLAIRGKLVPQDPNDEPASVLLERIRKEKDELIKAGKLKRDKRESIIFRGEDNSYYEKFGDGSIQCIDEAIPFIIPQGWCWCKLGTCLDVRDGTHDTPKYVTEGIPLVTSKNLNNGSIDFSNVKYISQADHDAISLRSKVDDNDILFAMIGSIGNPVLYHGEANFSIKNMALFKSIPNGMLMDYVFWWLYLSQNSMKKEAAGGLQGFVSLKYLRNFFIPVPPLPEQMRIINTIQMIITQINSIEDLIKEKN